jgi:hypothetical protein
MASETPMPPAVHAAASVDVAVTSASTAAASPSTVVPDPVRLRHHLHSPSFRKIGFPHQWMYLVLAEMWRDKSYQRLARDGGVALTIEDGHSETNEKVPFPPVFNRIEAELADIPIGTPLSDDVSAMLDHRYDFALPPLPQLQSSVMYQRLPEGLRFLVAWFAYLESVGMLKEFGAKLRSVANMEKIWEMVDAVKREAGITTVATGGTTIHKEETTADSEGKGQAASDPDSRYNSLLQSARTILAECDKLSTIPVARLKEAGHLLADASDLKPTAVECPYYLAYIFFQLEKYDLATKYLNQARQLSPDYPLIPKLAALIDAQVKQPGEIAARPTLQFSDDAISKIFS